MKLLLTIALTLGLAAPAFANNTIQNIGMTYMSDVFKYPTHDKVYKQCNLPVGDRIQKALDRSTLYIIDNLPLIIKHQIVEKDIDIVIFAKETASRMVTSEAYAVAQRKKEDICVTLERNNNK